MEEPNIVVIAVYVERHGDEPEEVVIVKDVDQRAMSRWELPGGKIESKESAEAAAVRHVASDVGISIDPERLRHVKDIRRQEGLLRTFRLNISAGERSRLTGRTNKKHVLVVTKSALKDGSNGEGYLPRRQRSLMAP